MCQAEPRTRGDSNAGQLGRGADRPRDRRLAWPPSGASGGTLPRVFTAPFEECPERAVAADPTTGRKLVGVARCTVRSSTERASLRTSGAAGRRRRLRTLDRLRGRREHAPPSYAGHGRGQVVARVPRHLRRTVFGRDPAGYARARLSYPPRLYRILADRCGLGPGASVFEVGPGTGIATRELLARGVERLTLVEADPRLARYLRRTLRAGRTDLTILESPFERARLAPAAFDLGLAASSFHWVPPRAGLRRVARALRPGGWWASWNNHHGDPYRPDRFQRALEALYEDLRPSSRARASTAAEEATARRREAAGGRRRLALLRARGRSTGSAATTSAGRSRWTPDRSWACGRRSPTRSRSVRPSAPASCTGWPSSWTASSAVPRRSGC